MPALHSLLLLARQIAPDTSSSYPVDYTTPTAGSYDIATPTFTALSSIFATATPTPAFVNPDNVIQSNQPLTLNGQPVFALEKVEDLLLRSSAATLLLVLLVVWATTFRNKRSAVSVMVAVFLSTEAVAVILELLPKILLLPNSAILSVGLGVGCFMISSEAFNWVLYLRFSIVTPWNPRLRWATLTWLTLESLIVFVNYVYWFQQALAEGGDTTKANRLYYWVSIVQAVTALSLSSHFVKAYYLPRLKLTRSGTSLIPVFLRNGILYLLLESLLHLGFLLSSNLLPHLRTGATNLLTALRYAVFLLFVLALRAEMQRSQPGSPKPVDVCDPGHHHLQPGNGNGKVGIAMVRKRGMSVSNDIGRGTFDDWSIPGIVDDAGEDGDVAPLYPPPPPRAATGFTLDRRCS
ncbi:hypothetical protein HKX48_009446 [Thoreauomyces humboldtii]|nr:hypothetical protein HKX48_009446 [Thoreauomyces humboldtii]